MTKEHEFILTVLGDYILKKSTSSVDGMDWADIYEYTHKHQIDAIFYYQCRSFIPSEYLEKYISAYSATVYYYNNRRIILAELENALAEIPYVIVKGSSMLEYYPVPSLRTMGDTDIVVKSGYKKKAHDIFIKNGFICKSRPAHEEWTYVKNGMEFELHDTLLEEDAVNTAEFTDFFADFFEHCHNGRMDKDYHYIYLICHLRKHLMKTGAGFRQFTDLAVLAEYDKELNWKKIEKELKKLGIYEFAELCYGFINRWFGVASPFGSNIPDDDFYEKATDNIFSGGVFGAEKNGNLKNTVVNEANNSKHPRLFIYMKVLSLYFPGYKQLIASGRYPFVKGRPYLLPLAWIIRAVRGLARGKNSQIHEMLMFSYASTEKMEERGEHLRKWGLIK